MVVQLATPGALLGAPPAPLAAAYGAYMCQPLGGVGGV